jgi:hypothetical protein
MVRSLAGVLAIACAATVAGWVSTGPAEAASALQVTQLECSIHPGLFDVMYIRNNGDATQDLSGWRLVSDPEASEQMSLTVAGALNPGQQLIVVAGLHGVAVPSQNLYLWTNLEVLRDGEPVDYVKLLDGSGALVSGMDCTGQPLGVAPAPAEPQPQSQGQQTAPTTQTGTSATAPKGKGPKGLPSSGGAVADDGSLPWMLLAAAGVAMGAGAAVLRVAGVRHRNRW